MKRLILLSSLFCLLLAGCDSHDHKRVNHNTVNIGVVNMHKVMQSTPEVKKIKDQMHKQFAPSIKEIKALRAKYTALANKLHKNASTMTKQQRHQLRAKLGVLQKHLVRKAHAIQMAYFKATHQAMLRLESIVNVALAKVAKKHGLDLILTKQSVAYSKSDLNVTGEIIRKLS